MNLSTFRSSEGRARFVEAYEAGMRQLPTPVWTRDVETTFGTVRAYQFGEGVGTPLLLLPGKTASTPLWATNLPSLMAIRPVVSMDLLGEPGLSVQTQPIRTSKDQAQWLAEALGALALPRVHLLGVSFGGWSAVNLAHHHREKIASIITVDPANTFGRYGLKVILFSLTALPGVPQRVRNWGLKWISGGVEAPQDLPEGRVIAAGMKEFTSHLPAPDYPSDGQLRGLTAPTLVLIAGRSVIHTPAKAEARARQLLPNGQVELWPDASHSLNGEFPDRLAERVRAFLDGVEPIAGSSAEEEQRG